jgi:nicotinamide mononucleotide transporter
MATELLGAATGLLCVILLVRKNAWSWPLGIANNVFFAILFFGTQLYAISTLQIISAAIAGYGWWSWSRGRDGRAAIFRHMRGSEALRFAAVLSAIATIACAILTMRTDAASPIADAIVLALGLGGTFAQARRIVESWLLWLAVDVISVALHASRGLYPTAMVYVVFACLCVVGLRSWRAVAVR